MTNHPLDRSQKLVITNPWYQSCVTEFWEQQLSWDGQDITANTLLPNKNREAKAVITAKSSGILAGAEEISYLLEKEGIEYTFQYADGQALTKGDTLMSITGKEKKLLQVERVVLNVLSRLSGIATLSKKAIECIPKTVILCPTRKTLWGPIDKKGVVIAGGGTHRLGLFDAILVKENHLALLDNGINDAVSLIEHSTRNTQDSFWEIEIETEEEFYELLKNLPNKRPGVIMLDNFSAEGITLLLQSVKIPEGIYIEASGGITLENIKQYANTGVSALSAGFLTNAAKPVDFSMRI